MNVCKRVEVEYKKNNDSLSRSIKKNTDRKRKKGERKKEKKYEQNANQTERSSR